jgi:hypothetical protein
LGSIFWRVRAAIALAMEMASMNPKSEMIIAVERSLAAMLQSKRGTRNAGSPAGTSPTTAPPAVIRSFAESSTFDPTESAQLPG